MLELLGVRKEHRTPVALLLALFALQVWKCGQIDYVYGGYSLDFPWYRAMAQAPPGMARHVEEPFAYRVLGPFLVWLSPFPEPVTFHVLTTLFCAALVFIFYAYLCHHGERPEVAALAVAFFLCNKWFFSFMLWDSFQINDALALLCVVALFWAMDHGRWRVFGLVFLLGALARETTALMVPTAAVFLFERRRLASEWRPLLLAVVPGIVCYVLIRLVVNTEGGVSLSAALTRWPSRKTKNLRLAYFWLLHAWHPLLAAPFIFWSTTRRFFAQRKYALFFFGLVYVSTLFGSDFERLLAPSFVVFYWLLARIINQWLLPHGVARGLLLVAAMSTSLSAWIGTVTWPSRSVSWTAMVTSIVVATLVCLWCRIAPRAAKRPGGAARVGHGLDGSPQAPAQLRLELRVQLPRLARQ